MSNARDKANIPSLNFSSTGIDDNATSTAITIDSNERVGIGTSSPANNLDIATNNSNEGITIKTTGNTNNVIIGDANRTAAFGGILNLVSKWNGTDVASIFLIAGSDTTNKDNGLITFRTSAANNISERMRIDSSGNVGIGTSSPTEALEVKGRIILDGDGSGNNNGTLIIDGSATSSSQIRFYQDGTAKGYLTYWDSYDTLALTDGAGNGLHFSPSTQRVGIGTSSPDEKLTVVGNIRAEAWSTPKLQLKRTGNNAGNGYIECLGADDSVDYKIAFAEFAGAMSFDVGGSERMRIDSSGNLLLGTTSITGTGGFIFQPNLDDGAGRLIFDRVATTASSIVIEFENGNSRVGEIQYNDTTTAYVTSSDYRLKENVSYDFDATTRIKQLKPARFNFIINPNKTVDGFLAHEVQTVVPEAITGEKDETETKEKVVVNANDKVIAENIEQADWETGKIVDEEGNTQYPTDSTWEATKVVPVYQGIDQAKLVPLLVKTIQELEARITALETNQP